MNNKKAINPITNPTIQPHRFILKNSNDTRISSIANLQFENWKSDHQFRQDRPLFHIGFHGKSQLLHDGSHLAVLRQDR